MHRAACEGDVDAIRVWCAQNPEGVAELDDDGWSALHYGCFYGQAIVVEELLSCKAHPSLPAVGTKATPLHLAAGTGHAGCVRLLVGHPNCDPTLLDSEKKTAKQLCLELRQNEWEATLEML